MGVYDFFGAIWEMLKAAWDWIVQLVVKIISFVRNIVAFFKDRRRLERLRREKQLLAVAVKENLQNGNVNVINCLFDEDTCEVVDMEEDAQIMKAEDMDQQTRTNFGDKDMLVLK